MAAAAKIARLGAVVALAGRLAGAQATLPTAYTGPWQEGDPPDGWVFAGLGSPDYAPDYDGVGDGAAKLDDAGDSVSVQYAGPAASVSFWIRGLAFSGGVFRVEQSADGASWSTLATYAPPPTNATFQALVPSLHARHVRFLYAERTTGNVGLDGISIAASPFFVIEGFARQGEGALVTVAPTVVGRLYALQYATNLAANPVPWVQASQSYATTNELDLLDPLLDTPRSYRVLDVTP